jgi:hypothetical protein
LKPPARGRQRRRRTDPGADDELELTVVGELPTHPLGLGRLGVPDLTKATPAQAVYLGSWRRACCSISADSTSVSSRTRIRLEARLRAGLTLLIIPSETCTK